MAYRSAYLLPEGVPPCLCRDVQGTVPYADDVSVTKLYQQSCASPVSGYDGRSSVVKVGVVYENGLSSGQAIRSSG